MTHMGGSLGTSRSGEWNDPRERGDDKLVCVRVCVIDRLVPFQ